MDGLEYIMIHSSFEWDQKKDLDNQKKHHVTFETAQFAFLDKNRVIAEDIEHSQKEYRYFCFGMIDRNILTVRFTYRNQKIRIFGAGYWRKGKQIYEKENTLY